MFKEFVSEKQIEEVKKKRQEEWEKVRRPDQPLGKCITCTYYMTISLDIDSIFSVSIYYLWSGAAPILL